MSDYAIPGLMPRLSPRFDEREAFRDLVRLPAYIIGATWAGVAAELLAVAAEKKTAATLSKVSLRLSNNVCPPIYIDFSTEPGIGELPITIDDPAEWTHHIPSVSAEDFPLLQGIYEGRVYITDSEGVTIPSVTLQQIVLPV